MALIEFGAVKVDVEQLGAGRDLVLLHSLPAGPAVEDYAERIAGLLAALRLPRETDVLGNGFGGFIAAALAARHGERFDRLIIVDSLATFPEPAKQPLRVLAARVAKEGMAGALDIAVRRSGARFQEISGCGHCPQIEKPEAFVEAVEGFLTPA